MLLGRRENRVREKRPARPGVRHGSTAKAAETWRTLEAGLPRRTSGSSSPAISLTIFATIRDSSSARLFFLAGR